MKPNPPAAATPSHPDTNPKRPHPSTPPPTFIVPHNVPTEAPSTPPTPAERAEPDLPPTGSGERVLATGPRPARHLRCISEMREHPRCERAQRPTPDPTAPHPAQRRIHPAPWRPPAPPAQKLDTSGPRPHHRRPRHRTTRIAGSVGVKNNSLEMENHATSAAIGRNASATAQRTAGRRATEPSSARTPPPEGPVPLSHPSRTPKGRRYRRHGHRSAAKSYPKRIAGIYNVGGGPHFGSGLTIDTAAERYENKAAQ